MPRTKYWDERVLKAISASNVRQKLWNMQLEVVRKEKGVVESFKLIPLFQLLQNDAKQDWEGVEGSGEGLPPPLILHSQLRYCVWLKLCTTYHPRIARAKRTHLELIKLMPLAHHNSWLLFPTKDKLEGSRRVWAIEGPYARHHWPDPMGIIKWTKLKHICRKSKFFSEPFWRNCNFSRPIEAKALPWDLEMA